MNLTADGRISWERESSCTPDSNKDVERWQNRLHEVRILDYNMMVRLLCCVTTEARYLPTYGGLTVVDEFLNKYESAVLEQQRFDALTWALRTTLARWRGMHQGSFEDWRGCRKMMCLHFGKPQLRMRSNHQRWNNLHTHLSRWVRTYVVHPTQAHTTPRIENQNKI